jgi:hypothetical protein
MRALLRDGGLLFVTTGNAAPYAKRLTKWRYVIPEIHISFFEPETLEIALAAAGFAPEHPRYGRSYDPIFKFKVMKNLGIRRRSALTDLVPAFPLALLGNKMTRLKDHPVGRAGRPGA